MAARFRVAILPLLGALLGSCAPPSYPPTRAHPLLSQPLPALHHLRTLDGHTLEVADAHCKPAARSCR